MNGFYDYLRMGLGWWNSPAAPAPVDGSILVAAVDSVPAITMADYAVPTIVMDDFSIDSAGIDVGMVEMV